MKKRINTDKAPSAIGPYSQAVEIGNMVYTSGQLGFDPVSGQLLEGVEAQAKQAMENLKAVLAEAGLGLDDIVKTLVFITDMGNFGKVNEVYAQYINGDVLPARSCVEVSALPRGGLVEIEAVAFKK